MKCEIIGDTAFPMLRAELGKGESIKAESGAMVAMSDTVHLTGKAEGGIGKALGRMLLTRESFFLQNLHAKEGPGWCLLASATPGEIAAVEVEQGRHLVVQKGGFLAGTTGIEVASKMQGLGKGLMSGEGFFVVKIGGHGTVYLATYGSIYPLTLGKGEEVVIDNGHLVAWDGDMQYKITKGAKSWMGAMFTTGEGLACRFYGPGRVLIQTRNPQQLGAWISPYIIFPRRG
ncbi:MAG: TIGR00266 family protein [Alphaproteobacteria bacterium]|nr:TIGR00266 family protein [Alphaproteobacteria bacterium]